jgi:hypothetical protein
VHVDLDTLATALYVKVDDELKASPQLNRWRPRVGIAPKITDAELITVSVMQVLLGYHDESRWIRYARKALIHLFSHLPKQPGYNKRLRTLGRQISHLIALLAADTELWQHPIRIADFGPVQCGTFRPRHDHADVVTASSTQHAATRASNRQQGRHWGRTRSHSRPGGRSSRRCPRCREAGRRPG